MSLFFKGIFVFSVNGTFILTVPIVNIKKIVFVLGLSRFSLSNSISTIKSSAFNHFNNFIFD